MITAHNIGTSYIVNKDFKRKKSELITRYNPIGLIDDQTDPKEAANKFSMHGRVRNLSVSSAK
jgi:hypothetical protein